MVREAREWPENLGVGKPYPELVKSDLEGAVMLLIDDSKSGHPPSPEELKTIREKIIHPVLK